MTTCTICNTTLDGEFCKNCGQQNTQKKLDLKSFFSDLSSNLLDLDKTVFFNIYYVLRYPKKVIENYWAGFRNYYYNPGKVLFYFVTLAGLSSYILGNSLCGIDIIVDNNISSQFIFILIIYPLLILASFLTYRKHKKTFIEHATASIYIISSIGIMVLIFQSLFTLLNLTESNDSIWLLILLILVITWDTLVYTQKKKFFYKVINGVIEFIILLLLIYLLTLIPDYFGILNISGAQLD